MQDETGTYGTVPADGGRGQDPDRPDAAAGPAAEPPRPVTVPRPETGELRVDAALGLLDDLSERPVTEHPARFEQVHARLGEVLGELSPSRMPRPGGLPGRDGS
jgi:hypothetical protein